MWNTLGKCIVNALWISKERNKNVRSPYVSHSVCGTGTFDCQLPPSPKLAHESLQRLLINVTCTQVFCTFILKLEKLDWSVDDTAAYLEQVDCSSSSTTPWATSEIEDGDSAHGLTCYRSVCLVSFHSCGRIWTGDNFQFRLRSRFQRVQSSRLQ